MDGWLLASPYGSYGSLAMPYREASGSYSRRAVNLRPSTVTAQRAALPIFLVAVFAFFISNVVRTKLWHVVSQNLIFLLWKAYTLPL